MHTRDEDVMTHRILAAVAGFAMAVAAGTTGASAQSSTDFLDGFYLSGSGGVGIVSDLEFDLGANDVNIEFDTGFGFQGAVGYRINKAWRVELEGSYLSADVDTASFGTSAATTLDGYTAISGSLNAYLDFGNGTFSPYVGGGLGISQITLDEITFANGTTLQEIDDTTLTGQLMLGLGYKIDTNLRITAEYRFKYLGDIELTNGATTADDSTFGHMLNVGLKYEF